MPFASKTVQQLTPTTILRLFIFFWEGGDFGDRKIIRVCGSSFDRCESVRSDFTCEARKRIRRIFKKP